MLMTAIRGCWGTACRAHTAGFRISGGGVLCERSDGDGIFVSDILTFDVVRDGIGEALSHRDASDILVVRLNR